MCLYFSLSVLHVSDSLVHHQERRFGAVHRNCWRTTVKSTGIYQLRYTAPKRRSCDGLKSPKHVEHLMKNKDAL